MAFVDDDDDYDDDDDDEVDRDAAVNATIKLDLSCSNVDGISLNNTSVTLIIPNNKKTWE